MTTKQLAVIGNGSWATAIVKILSNQTNPVLWYMRKEEDVAYISKYHHNPRYLSSVEFNPAKVKLSAVLDEVVEAADVLVLAIPSAFCHAAMKELTKEKLKGKIIFSAIKGIIPEYNLIVGEYLQKVFDIPETNIGVISGPCHAEEVAMEKLSYLTLAAGRIIYAEEMAEQMRCRYIRVKTSDDVYGTEYAAVLKNVVAIGVGICHGLGYGDNFISVLIANAIQEIERFVDAVKPMKREIKASAYLGDLLVTAYSQFSRNRMFGAMLGKGYSVKMAQLEMNMVAEGYYAVKCVHEINKALKIDMPISNAVYNIVYEKISPVIEIKLLTEKLS